MHKTKWFVEQLKGWKIFKEVQTGREKCSNLNIESKPNCWIENWIRKEFRIAGLLIWLKNVEIIWISTILWLTVNMDKKTTKNKSKKFKIKLSGLILKIKLL